MMPSNRRAVDEREHDAPPGLARAERNLAAPDRLRAMSVLQVAESLSEIQTEQHESAPLGIVAARSQDAFDFVERERAPLRFLR